MVIERFRDNDMVPVYQRLREDDLSLPKKLEYVESWVEANFSRCFQLMRCDDLRLVQASILRMARLRRDVRNRPRRHKPGGAGFGRTLPQTSGGTGLRDRPAGRPRQVDNVTFCVHAWPPAAPRR